MQIWQHLGKAPPDAFEDAETGESYLMRITEGVNEPHPGLRSYPFLGQASLLALTMQLLRATASVHNIKRGHRILQILKGIVHLHGTYGHGAYAQNMACIGVQALEGHYGESESDRFAVGGDGGRLWA